MKNGIEEFETGMWGVFLNGEQIACVKNEADAGNTFTTSVGKAFDKHRREKEMFRGFLRGMSVNIDNMLKGGE